MMARMPLHPLDFVSTLISVSNEGSVVYRGTAFPIGSAGRWLTAGHSTKRTGAEDIAICVDYEASRLHGQGHECGDASRA